MKIQIRPGCFETNSSSTHSLVIMTDDEYKKYVNGDTILDRYGNVIDQKKYAEAKERITAKVQKLWEAGASDCKYYHSQDDMIEEMLDEEFDAYCMETIHESRNINGVNVHAISIYGYED
jgi:hypothetical protein